MTPPDFAALLADVIGLRTADVLAAKVPDLCPDCHDDPEWDGMVKTGGVTWDGEYYYADCAHPNAPTIGTLLAEAAHARPVAAEAGVDVATLVAYGRNVATAVPENPRFRDDCVWTSADDMHTGVLELLAALRTVEVER